MDPIPTWVRRLWDVWDLRVLVLLSFTLQLILSIFGNRIKYISSLWISVLVWSTYLTADWVATAALGKLSNGDPGKTNVLWAIWAPLILLHLGGPDCITAYSLEDNQLWMRHLLGLVVQLFMVIYVILMSWENSWFSFISLPALVAGLIKYGERTWVLKLVSGDNYINSLPLADLLGQYGKYSSVLILAHNRLQKFRFYLESQGVGWGSDFYDFNVTDWSIWFDAAEVTMGFMYDLLYTKATIVYSKGGCILRCISFGCTVTVLVGLIFRILLSKSTHEKDDEIDIAITGVLVVGALALEIYAAIVSFFSNWGMVWLIKQGREEWVIWLSQRFPWLFNKKKNWSHTMGQFDLLGYCLKVSNDPVQMPSSKIIRSMLGRDYEHKWNIYRHKTTYSVDPSVYNAILDDYKAHNFGISNSVLITGHEWAEFRAMLERMDPPYRGKFGCLHLATEVCYQLEIEWDGDEDPSGSDYSLWKQIREVYKALSDYVMYLLIMHPSLLPDDGTRNVLESFFRHPENLTNPEKLYEPAERDKIWVCRNWTKSYIHQRGFGYSRNIAEGLKRKGKLMRWKILRQMWWDTLRKAVGDQNGYGQKNAHFQRLREGGEFLTFLWFSNPTYVAYPMEDK